MFRRGLPIILLFVISMMMLIILPVHGGSSLDSLQQTWPSRTPTSNAPPNSTQPPSDGGTSEPPPPEGSPPAPSATESLPATLPPLAAENFLPTAALCQAPPTALALGTVAVRSGPGIAYDRVGNLVFSEVRIIVGRTQYFPWWQIQFTGDQTGWVSAEAVDVQGYTVNVPIISPPLLDNNTPEPGPEWEPTADPTCIMTVNAASTTPAPIQVTRSLTETTETEISPTLTMDQAMASVVTESPVDKAVEVLAERATIEISGQPDSSQGSSTGTGNGSNLNWILVVGLLLILAAVAIYMIQRRSI